MVTEGEGSAGAVGLGAGVDGRGVSEAGGVGLVADAEGRGAAVDAETVGVRGTGGCVVEGASDAATGAARGITRAGDDDLDSVEVIDGVGSTDTILTGVVGVDDLGSTEVVSGTTDTDVVGAGLDSAAGWTVLVELTPSPPGERMANATPTPESARVVRVPAAIARARLGMGLPWLAEAGSTTRRASCGQPRCGSRAGG